MTYETQMSLGLAYLRFLGPEKWHCFARQWNMDDGLEFFDWIVRQPDCERATAQLIFWRCVPFYYLPDKGQEPDATEERQRASDEFKLLKVIADNWTRGFYTKNRLSGLIYTGEHEGQSYFEYPITLEIFGIKSILETDTDGRKLSDRPGDRLKGLFVPLTEPVFLNVMQEYRAKEEGCEPHRLPWIIPDSIGQILSGDPVNGKDFDIEDPTWDTQIAQWNIREDAQ